MELLKFLKDYWFLITLVISVATAVGYMVVFHVTPWDKYREMSERKKAVALHLRLGQSLLDRGLYEGAVQEFEAALELEEANPRALESKRKADLFLKLRALDWKPGEAMAYREVFANPRDPNILLFMGKLHERIGEPEPALDYFKRAQAAYKQRHPEPEADYYDALESLGWEAYFRDDLVTMARNFERMCQVAAYDYRGFHGYGYARYMMAIGQAQADPKAAITALNDGTQALFKAMRFVPRFLVINTDIGEIARVIDPDFSINSHQVALQCLLDEELKSLPGNVGGIGLRLLSGNERTVYLEDQDDKIAWVKYALALDYYVKAKREGAEGRSAAEHDKLVAEAEALQVSQEPKAVYDDQKTIVDRLLAAQAKSRAA